MRELWVAALAAAGVLVAQIAAAGAVGMIPRHLWLDEVLTYLLASDPSVRHSMAALAGGAETNPPPYFLLLRAFAIPLGGMDETVMRLFALCSIWLAMVGLYATLRRAYGVLPAAAGMIFLASHDLVVRHTFEARFYGPMLAAAIWTCFFLQGATTPRRRTVINAVLLAMASLLLCTLHYFGIFALVIIMVAHLLWAKDLAGRPRWRQVAPALVGPAALAAWAPVFLRQRSHLTSGTWLKSTTAPLLWIYLKELFPPLPMLALALAIVLMAISIRRTARRDDLFSTEPWWKPDRRVASLLALVSMGVIVLLFSLTVQPALKGRYAIVTVAGMAVVLAHAVSRADWHGGLVVCVLLFLVSVHALTELKHTWVTNARHDAFDEQLDRMIADVRAHADVPCVFEFRHSLYPVCYLAPDVRDRSCFLDFDRLPLGSSASDLLSHPMSDEQIRFRTFERDMARNVAAFYPWPKLLRVNQLPADGRYYLVGHPQHSGPR
jgi:hypothetical protein